MNSQYKILDNILTEKQKRLYYATEAIKHGRGGITKVSKESGLCRQSIRRGILEIKEEKIDCIRQRNNGGGRKKVEEKDITLKKDLESLLNPKGDPMTNVLWTTKSLSNLSASLKEIGHADASRDVVQRILHESNYSLRANKKNIEGISNPDRDAQFQKINETMNNFERSGDPIISVDCKKKELTGNFKNNGKEWQAKGQDTIVNTYDFRNLADGKAVPYGIYDVIRNAGFINLGTDHDTASFAVESIRRWWNTVGKFLYPEAKKLLITSDGGGSNGVRNRLWKRELQKLSNEIGMPITVCHYPPATSKWNKIEHRLFSFISINWRAKPLTTLETIIELLSHTKTKEGLVVKAIIDKNTYPIGIKISDKEMKEINILRDEFHGEWNYTISPST
jgi:hypothetical protein